MFYCYCYNEMPRRRTLTGRKEREHNRLLMDDLRERQKRSRSMESNFHRENVHFLEYAFNFETAQKNLELKHCNLCHRRWFDLHIEEDGLCALCHKFQVKNEMNIFSTDNNMDPGPQPEVLKKLTFLEEQLIAQVHPVITVYKLKGGQFGYSGQVINFHQDITNFTTSLPHSIDTISKYIFVRRNHGEGYKDFIVNRDNVEAALIYLKNNNPWYRDIIIDENNLQCLPNNESIFQKIVLSQDRQQLSFNLDNEDNDQNILYDNVYESGAPAVTFQCNRKAVNNILNIQEGNDKSGILPWPILDSVPINEFTCDGYICRAFPTLFPTGKGDLRDTRVHKISNNKYFKFLMMYEDGRFAKHPRFRFFAFNSIMRWTALQNGSICVRKNLLLRNIETIEQLRELLQREPILYKSILSYNTNLRSSSSYWYARSRELVDMIEELGTPTIFMTLSAADLYWPELYRILDPDYNYANLNQNSEFVRKSKLLNSNPMIVSFFLKEKRLDTFMDHFVKKYFKVTVFWFRIEFQHRGSPHMHGIFWFENAPDLKNLNQDDITRTQEIVNYFDEFISTWHPDPSQIYDIHPSKLHFSDISDEDVDYNHLIRAVQMHKCSKAYCQRKKKNSSETICRFKYPKECVNESKIQFIQDNELEYISKRNNSYLNSHSPQILKIWRANVDSQAIVSIHAVLRYIAKYASKGEPRSDGMKDFIRQTVQESNTNSNVVQIIQKILIKMCAERDYSAQEIFWIIMGWPLYRSSRQFTTINFRTSGTWEYLNMNSEDGSIFLSNFLERYQQRLAKFEQMTLSDFCTKIYKRGSSYSMRKVPFILRVIPKVKYDPSCIDNENFYKQQVILHVAWRQLNDLNPDNNTWKIVYERHFKNNNDNSLSYELDQMLENLENEEDYEEMNSVQIEQLHDWMEIAAGPKNVNQEDDLGRREIDIRYQWHCISSKQLLNSLETFIENEKNAKNQRNPTISNYNYLLNVVFSGEQQKVINIFEKQLNYLLGYEEEQSIKRVVIQGKAGSGKSTLINYFTLRLNQTLGLSSYKLLAPTGAAAVNINGSTIHSKLLLGVNKRFNDLSLHALAEFQEELYGCKFIIIDEMSMIGCSLLRKIDLRLRRAFPSRQDEPFGGLFVYFFGDINQLPPVNDRPLYSNKIEGSEFLLEGKLLYTSSIQKYFFLSSSFRQNESQQVFRDILDRISNGECTVEDYKKLMTRSIQTLSLNERIFFNDAIRLFATNKDVKEFNHQKLKELCQPVAYIPAYHNCSKAKSASAEILGGLEPFIILSIGSKVMLRSNLWVENGLVNGALGYVEDIIYEENCSPPDEMPRVIMVRFENYSHSTYGNSGCIPILPITKFWKSGDTNYSRKQFPLQLAFAITIHKSQGLTLDKAVVDIGEKETSIGLTYVAFSRVKTLEGLALHRRFPYDRLSSIKNSNMLKCRKEEEIRMRNVNALIQ